jgi:hypothetical protein
MDDITHRSLRLGYSQRTNYGIGQQACFRFGEIEHYGAIESVLPD